MHTSLCFPCSSHLLNLHFCILLCHYPLLLYRLCSHIVSLAAPVLWVPDTAVKRGVKPKACFGAVRKAWVVWNSSAAAPGIILVSAITYTWEQHLCFRQTLKIQVLVGIIPSILEVNALNWKIMCVFSFTQIVQMRGAVCGSFSPWPSVPRDECVHSWLRQLGSSSCAEGKQQLCNIAFGICCSVPVEPANSIFSPQLMQHFSKQASQHF